MFVILLWQSFVVLFRAVKVKVFQLSIIDAFESVKN